MKQINKLIISATVLGFLVGTAVIATIDARDMEKEALIRMDAALNHLVDVCTEQYCIYELENAWYDSCLTWYDKLDTCKNGKLEGFLNSHGIATK